MTDLDDAAALGRTEQGLAVVATLRADSTIQSSLVNAGVLDHPSTGEPVLAFVTYGKVKLTNPDDPQPWLDAAQLRLLLRAVFAAAGGTHEDWDEYDRVMLEQRRTVVLIEPTRIYSN